MLCGQCIQLLNIKAKSDRKHPRLKRRGKLLPDFENEKAKRFVNDLKEMPYSHLIKLTNIKIDYEYDVQGQARIVCYKKHD